MNTMEPLQNYLVLSRGQWDKDASPDDIQHAIDQFYGWLSKCVDEGKMKEGSRLRTERAVVSKAGVVTDGPYCEAKEIIGGYWFIMARSLREAAELLARSPCAKLGLAYEVRPLDPEPCSALKITNETPSL